MSNPNPKSKTFKTLTPNYMRTFQCTGSACEDTCCAGWEVSIDRKTYKKYKNLKNSDLKNSIDHAIQRKRTGATDFHYARIKMNSCGTCPLLNTEGLCSVQLNLGESYLSSTCATYPRQLNQVDEFFELSGFLSCPEIARLALLQENGIEFDLEEKEINDSTYVQSKIDLRVGADDIVSYFWELRMFAISLMQTRTLSIEDRLTLLGLFVKSVDEKVATNDLESIPALIATYERLLTTPELKSDLDAIPTNYLVKFKLMSVLVAAIKGKMSSSESYYKYSRQFLEGLEVTNDVDLDVFEANVKESVDNYFRPFLTSHEYVLENYLVNYIFANFFPLANRVTCLYDSYVYMVLRYSFFVTCLLGVARFNKGLSLEEAVRTIQAISRGVEHNNKFLKTVFNYVLSENLADQPHLTSLIRF